MDLNESTDLNLLILRSREHDDLAFAELVSRYTPMMNKLVATLESAPADRDELFAEACVGLHAAMLKYDLSQDSVTFGLFARICVRNRLLDLVRADADRPVGELDVELMGEEDSLEERLVDREIFDKLLGSAKDVLSDYEYRVLLLHIQGYKTSAIASMLSRTAKSVDNAKSRLFRRLRAEIGDILKY